MIDAERKQDTVRLRADGAEASFATLGAEALSWSVGGRQLLWHGDPLHWGHHAPVLFPVVGTSNGRVVRVDGREHPMTRHGFARDLAFAVIEKGEARVRFRLTDTPRTRVSYPYAFQLDVTASLEPTSLSTGFDVLNPSDREMPYAIGFHPAFPWPFAYGSPKGHDVVFEVEESPDVPVVTEEGLLARRARRVPLEGRRLPLDPSLFADDALVFLEARSKALTFSAPSGAAISMKMEGFPHLALWTKPGAPFLSMEAWTGHADLEGFTGELAGKPSMRTLAPGGCAHHAVEMSWRPA